MRKSDRYIDSAGNIVSFDGADPEEYKLALELSQEARECPDSNSFDAFWLQKVIELYDRRGISRTAARQKFLYKIAHDLSEYVAIRCGEASPPDYRDQLEELIRTKFESRRAFCDATGIPESTLSHVLARRKHLSIERLERALASIGYYLTITPNSGEAEN